MRSKKESYKVQVTEINDKYWGECCPNEKVISIAEKQQKDQRNQTFIHEWLHMLEFVWNISIPHKVVWLLEKPILDSLKRNKAKWIKFISSL